MKARIELLEVLAEAEEDVRTGRIAPISDTFQDLRKMIVDRTVIDNNENEDQRRRKDKCCGRNCGPI